MANPNKKGLVLSYCEVCGKEVYAAQQVRFCTKTSTCRVKYHQEQKRKKKIERALMVDMDGYQIYASFVIRFPDLKSLVDDIVLEFGHKQAVMMIQLVYATIAIREKELGL